MKHQKRRIFYMEDEELILDQWSEILIDEGYSVIKAHNAMEALKILDQLIERKEIVNCFILDVIIIPWDPFTDKETLDGFLTGLMISDRIIANYTKINNNYKIIFVTAALGVPGKVSERLSRYLTINRNICHLLRKPVKIMELLAAL